MSSASNQRFAPVPITRKRDAKLCDGSVPLSVWPQELQAGPGTDATDILGAWGLVDGLQQPDEGARLAGRFAIPREMICT